MNVKPGDAVINFNMQKKIQGTPLDAAIFFKKEKIVFYLKNLERFPEFKFDYYKYIHFPSQFSMYFLIYREKKNQASPEYLAFQEWLGKSDLSNVVEDKKYTTKDDQIQELKRILISKDQIILDQNAKIEELQKEIEALKTNGANKVCFRS
jgi:hypothetical protein